MQPACSRHPSRQIKSSGKDTPSIGRLFSMNQEAYGPQKIFEKGIAFSFVIVYYINSALIH
jgi:hypothetical protein